MDFAHWTIFLDALCRATRMEAGYLLSVDAGGASAASAAGGPGLSHEPAKHYNEYYCRLDPYRAPFFERPREGVMEAEALAPQAELERTEYYQDFAVRFDTVTSAIAVVGPVPRRLEQPHDWRAHSKADQHSKNSSAHDCRSEFDSRESAMKLLSLTRRVRAADLNAESRRLVEAVLPHMSAASRLGQAFARLEQRAMRAESALDSMAVPAFLLGGDRRVLHHNEAAEALCREADGLTLRLGRLSVADPAQQAHFDRLIAASGRVSGASQAMPGGCLAIARSGGKRALQARIFPLRHGSRATGPVAGVLVLVTDPAAAPSFDPSWLRELYVLTPAEADLANRLLAGRSLEEAAADRQVSLGTVRGQLKRILHKTGARGQPELMRLLYSLPQIHRRSE